ncbi:hypothetical protein NDN08_001403 [Rhodosorus marinus]|uniref:Uncharacterized protein n=1 Tax=Rhodosorus marinus TaxID=101924 RepID=A0AAV8UQX4_9RHOD|nr:hypothetical protein NDN08_001403 [Rhodosorus marinus]
MAVRSVDLDGNASKVVWGSVDGTVRQWDIGRSEWAAPSFRISGMTLKRVSYTPNGDNLALVSDKSSTVGVCEALNGNFVDKFSFKSHSSVVQDVSFVAQQQPGAYMAYAVTGDSSLRLWNATENVCMQSFHGHDRQVLCSKLSNDHNRLFSGSYDGHVRVWDVGTGETVLLLEGHRDGVMDISVSPDENRIVASTGDGQLIVWDVLTSQRIAKAKVHHGGPAYCVVYDSEGLWTASGGRDGKVILSDSTRRLRSKGELAGHSSSVFDLSWSADRRLLASGSRDGSVRLWGLNEGDTNVVVLDNAEDTSQVQDRHLKASFPQAGGAVAYSNPGQGRCLVCFEPYSTTIRIPMVSGVCGHTFTCRPCYEELKRKQTEPQCPLCRRNLDKVVPNFELLSLLSEGDDPDPRPSTVERSSPAPPDWVEINLESLIWTQSESSKLGEGAYGAVYSALFEGEMVCVRVLPTNLPELKNDHVSRMMSLRHRNVASIMGVVKRNNQNRIILYEYYSAGALRDGMKHLEDMSHEVKLSMAIQLCNAVDYLHSRKLSHGSLSSSSVLLTDHLTEWDSRSKLKVADAGLRYIARKFSSHSDQYRSPECWSVDQLNGGEGAFPMDIYALGVLLAELFSGKPAWKGSAPADIRTLVLDKDERPEILLDGMEAVIADTIRKCWQKDPAVRPKARDVLTTLSMIPTAPTIPDVP